MKIDPPVAVTSWTSWVPKLVSWKEFTTWSKVEAIRIGVNTAVVQPVKNFGVRALHYIETDDPETREEKIAFDLLTNQLYTAARALEIAHGQGRNRRITATALLSRDAGPLPTQEQVIFREAIQETKDFNSH